MIYSITCDFLGEGLGRSGNGSCINTCRYMYTYVYYIYIYMHACIMIYIYIYIERER